ncbi:MAG: hypothetical protein ACK6D3_10670 [Planctomycetaceae bacterium]
MKFASLPVLFLLAIVNAGYPVQLFAQGFGFQLKGNPQLGGGGGVQAPMPRGNHQGQLPQASFLPTAPERQHFPADSQVVQSQVAPQSQTRLRAPQQTQIPLQTILKAPPANTIRPQVHQPATTSPLTQGHKGGTDQPPVIRVPQVGGNGQKPAPIAGTTSPSLKISPGLPAIKQSPTEARTSPKLPSLRPGGQRSTPPATIGAVSGSTAKLPTPVKPLIPNVKGPAGRPGIAHPPLGIGKPGSSGPRLKSPEAIRDLLAGGIDVSGIPSPVPGSGGSGPGGGASGGGGVGGGGVGPGGLPPGGIAPGGVGPGGGAPGGGGPGGGAPGGGGPGGGGPGGGGPGGGGPGGVDIDINIGLGVGIGIPLPICPPYSPPLLPIDVIPCPIVFQHWCWYPGFEQCYGYTNGVGLPMIQEQAIIAELPVAEVVTRRLVVQIVPGTTVKATIVTEAEAGQVLLQYGEVALPAEVVDWQSGEVTFTVPTVALKSPVPVELIFINSRGGLIEKVSCELVAAAVVAATP